MQLQQLPKAEKFFKQIVDEKVQKYIQTSQIIANQFIKQKEQAQINSQQYLNSIEEVKRQIKILKIILITKVQVSENSLSDIQNLIKQYEEVLESYEKNSKLKNEAKQIQLKQDLKIQQKSKTINFQQYESFQQNSFVFGIQQQKIKQNSKIKKFLNKEKIPILLKSIEFFVLALMIVTFIKVIFLD